MQDGNCFTGFGLYNTRSFFCLVLQRASQIENYLIKIIVKLKKMSYRMTHTGYPG